MADFTYTVIDAEAPERACAPDMLRMAEQLAADAASGTPVRTGRLRRGWAARKDGNAAAVSNAVPYVWFVEYGTRNMRASAMLGRALAAARAAQ